VVESADDESEPVQKEARMKTSKVRIPPISARYLLPQFLMCFATIQKKAENFYSKANVKNKNRSKAALLRSLPVGKRTDRRGKK